MTFYVGQKVVCVNDAPVICSGVAFSLLQRDKIYTVTFVRSMPPEINIKRFGDAMVGLAEVARPYHSDWGFGIGRFRPVQEKGMSILRAIAANPKRELEVVE